MLEVKKVSKLFEDKDIDIYGGTLQELQELSSTMGFTASWNYYKPIMQKDKIIGLDRDTICMYAFSGCHVIYRLSDDECLLFINKVDPEVWDLTNARKQCYDVEKWRELV